jgi:hypothetical protein
VQTVPPLVHPPLVPSETVIPVTALSKVTTADHEVTVVEIGIWKFPFWPVLQGVCMTATLLHVVASDQKQLKKHITYNGSRLKGSLWDLGKLIPKTNW